MDAKQSHVERNPGMALDLGWVHEVRLQAASCANRVRASGPHQPARRHPPRGHPPAGASRRGAPVRAALMQGCVAVAVAAQRRTVKKAAQVGWLLRCVSLIDLTTLAGDDTATNVQRLCMKARRPLRDDFEKALNIKDKKITCGAICVYPNRVADAVKSLAGACAIPLDFCSTRSPACWRVRHRHPGCVRGGGLPGWPDADEAGARLSARPVAMAPGADSDAARRSAWRRSARPWRPALRKSTLSFRASTSLLVRAGAGSAAAAACGGGLVIVVAPYRSRVPRQLAGALRRDQADA
jgi:hypothetical protein